MIRSIWWASSRGSRASSGPEPSGRSRQRSHPHEIVGRPVEEGPARVEEALFRGAEPGQVVGDLGAEGQGEAVGRQLSLRVPLFQPSGRPNQGLVRLDRPAARLVGGGLQPAGPGQDQQGQRDRRPGESDGGPQSAASIREQGGAGPLLKIQGQDRPGRRGEEGDGAGLVDAERGQGQPGQQPTRMQGRPRRTKDTAPAARSRQ